VNVEAPARTPIPAPPAGSSRPAGGVTSGQVSPGSYGDRCGAVAGGAAWRARQGGRLATGGTTEGRLGCRANQGCEVSSLSVTGEEPGRTAEVPRNGAVGFRLRRSGTMAASGGAFLNPLPHPRGHPDPTTDQGSSVSPTPADAPQQRFAVVAHVNSGQPLGPLSPDVPSKLVAGPLRVLWGRMPFMGEDAEAEITGDEELPQGPFGSISFANSGAGPSGEARVASRLRMVRTGFPAGPGSLGRGSVGGRPRCGRRAACPPAPSG
jgi:hypothetical protein